MQKRIAVDANDNAQTLHARLAELGAVAIVEALGDLEAHKTLPITQPDQGVTYARKIGKEESRLDWSRAAVDLERAVRAFFPAVAQVDGEKLRLWRARVVDGKGAPGELLQAGPELVVACGEQALSVLELQRPGGRRLGVAEFLRGRSMRPGDRWQ